MLMKNAVAKVIPSDIRRPTKQYSANQGSKLLLPYSPLLLQYMYENTETY
jgi:hypothetical protein